MKLEGYREKNKKKTGVIIFTVCCILLIAFVYFYNSFALYEVTEQQNIIEGNVTDPGDLYFVYFLNGEAIKTIPKKDDGYVFDAANSKCTKGASPEFDTASWSIKVNNMTVRNTRCDIYFKNA